MSTNLVICKCPEKGPCRCIEKARRRRGKYKILRDGKIVSLVPAQRDRPVDFIEAVKGPPGPRGPAGRVFDPTDLEHLYDYSAMRRTFTFDAITGPTMFSKFDAVVINNQLIPLDKAINIKSLNQYLVDHHSIYPENNVTYYAYMPSKVNTLKLRPVGYVDPNSQPQHTIASRASEESLNFVVCGEEGPGHLDSSQMVRMIRTVAQEVTPEQLTGPRGFQGGIGDQGPQGVLVLDQEMPEYCSKVCTRTFTFSLTPEMFNQYQGLLINYGLPDEQAITFPQTLKFVDLKEYLYNRFNLAQVNATKFGVRIPNKVMSLALKPLGYRNIEHEPNHYLVSSVSGGELKFLVCHENQDADGDGKADGNGPVLGTLPCSFASPIPQFSTESYVGSDGTTPSTVRNDLPNKARETPGSQYVNLVTGQQFVFNGAKWIEISAKEVSHDVQIHGNLSASQVTTIIDHPLDPRNKNLIHHSINSSEMLNTYNGNIQLNKDGQTTVELPEWFGHVNQDYRYQLTAVGQACPELHISREIEGGRFQITGTPFLKVSWQVSGVRTDQYAEKYGTKTEMEKTNKGSYLHPEFYAADD